MIVAAPPVRRLAGLRFEVEAPPTPAAVLPRMDVAGFVGFAASGPLHVPVAVEDVAQYESLFGGDIPLAWDREAGEPVFARLGPAVRAFFENGGRRAWIVRVAGTSATGRELQVPGLLADGPDLSRATLPARSEGSWADDLRVGTALGAVGVRVEQLETDRFLIEAPALRTLGPGDLLRLRNARYERLVVLTRVEPAGGDVNGSPPLGFRRARRGRALVVAETDPRLSLWLDRVGPIAAAGPASYVTTAGETLTGWVEVDAGSAVASPPLFTPLSDASVTVSLHTAATAEPAMGSFLHVRDLVGGGQLWLVVATVVRPGGATAPLLVTGRPAWILSSPPPGEPLGDAELLSLELRVERASGERWALRDLGFAPGHRRYVGDLPTDELLYGSDVHTGRRRRDPVPELWTAATDPRFPLAGRTDGPVLYPIGMTATIGDHLGPVATSLPPAARDGLTRFGDHLFLDPGLRLPTTRGLLGEADAIRFVRERPRTLVGIHALIGVDEVTIVAVPDAGHRRWRRAKLPAPPPAPPSERVRRPRRARFGDCAWRVLETPSLSLDRVGATGPYTVRWSTAEDGLRYRLERIAAGRRWTDATVAYVGSASSLAVHDVRPGMWYYRVRAELGDLVSEWSGPLLVRTPSAGGRVLERRSRFRAGDLLAIQRSLARMCAARGDLLGVLSLPAHYRAEDAVGHVAALAGTEPSNAGRYPPLDPVLPLDASEARSLSHVALYHPWLFTAATTTPGSARPVPPDGAVAGVLARRAATRGAWVAPANEPLTGVLALEPVLPEVLHEALLTAQVNAVRHEAEGFLCLSQDTLAAPHDGDVRPVNVRRLLCLLRRLALLRGADYVFEPNDATFRRGIQRLFEDVLQGLFLRGAFAGSVPETAFQVVTADPPNTRQSVDAGRFVVELKVAPSHPLSFLTVRLVQSGERGLTVEAP